MRRARHEPSRRIERDEELVGRGARGPGETVQQRGLARVRIADERDDGHAARLATIALEPAVDAHTLEIFGDLTDAMADHPAVGLDLGLAGSPRPDAGAQPLEMFPLTDQTREQIRELRQLDLELALHRPGAL